MKYLTTVEEFKQVLNDSSPKELEDGTMTNAKLSIFDFFTDWCGPCNRFAPIYEELEKENKEVGFYKVNVEGEGEELGEFQEIYSLPTLKFFKGDKLIDSLTGAQPKDKMQSMIDLYKN